MDRSEMEQHIFDTLGKILVDKSIIQEKADPLMSELVLEPEDFDDFFAELQSYFGITLPTRIKTDLSHLPDSQDYSQLTLQGLVDVILIEMNNKKSR
ncbi:hypothetical protein [Pseudomonas sp. UBA1879]|uniref:hypothetical protein n=1 Tax=Pseudomonas sp. UBA1879 TaxID=1947305 RepID=UPI0025D77DC9|nr:hypothetical protein [Pseudomonas sp. UBA1879]